MSLTSFRTTVPDLLPPWMQGNNCRTLWGAFGAQLDANADTVMFARLQAIPFAGGGNATRQGAARLRDGRLIECEPFVLAIHSEQRGIRLYETESTLSRRIRLAAYLPLHAQRGTFRGTFNHVRPYFATYAGYPGIDIAHRTGTGKVVWHRMSAAGKYSILRPVSPNFDYDGTNRRSRWFAFFRMTGTGVAAPPLYGGGHDYGDGTLYGGGVTSAQCADLISMLLDWKAAHSWLAGVWLVWDPAAVDPTATPTQDAEGRWSLPNGANTWSALVDPTTGKPTRPLGIQQIYDNPPP